MQGKKLSGCSGRLSGLSCLHPREGLPRVTGEGLVGGSEQLDGKDSETRRCTGKILQLWDCEWKY